MTIVTKTNATSNQPTVGDIVKFMKWTWKIVSIDDNAHLPNYRALRIEQGFDANHYKVERVTTSKRQKAATNFLLRGTNNTWQSAW